MIRRLCAALCVLVVTLVACDGGDAIPVPESKRGFVGRWSAGPSFLELSAAGRFDCEIEGESQSLLIRSGSLRSFEGNRICVGVGSLQSPECFEATVESTPAGAGDAIRVLGVVLRKERSAP